MPPSRHHAPIDRASTSLLSGRLAAGIAASTRVSALAPGRRPPPAPGAAAPATRRRDEIEPFAPFDDAELEGPDPVAADPELRRELQERMEVHRRALLPGYERRLLLEGRAIADAWLRHEARERGQREAEALRRESGDPH